jgi:hypothetical protein
MTVLQTIKHLHMNFNHAIKYKLLSDHATEVLSCCCTFYSYLVHYFLFSFFFFLSRPSIFFPGSPPLAEKKIRSCLFVKKSSIILIYAIFYFLNCAINIELLCSTYYYKLHIKKLRIKGDVIAKFSVSVGGSKSYCQTSPLDFEK